MSAPITTVLFDLSGVVTSSPWAHLTEAGGGSLELLIGPYHEDTDHPWHRLERGEIPIREWAELVRALGEAQGITVDFAPMGRLATETEVHTVVVDRIKTLREEGYRTGLVTNNVKEGSAGWRAMVPVDELFDVVVDSSEEGIRKPNPAIFLLALERLGRVEPANAVFLDDAPGNLDGARLAGLEGILVGDDPADAIVELDRLLQGRGAPTA